MRRAGLDKLAKQKREEKGEQASALGEESSDKQLIQCISHQADVENAGRLSLAADAGKRLREEEEPSHNGAADRLDNKDGQERHYRGQRVETPSYPGSARTQSYP